MSTQRFVLTGLLILALLAPGASASVAEPAAPHTDPSSVAAPESMPNSENTDRRFTPGRFNATAVLPDNEGWASGFHLRGINGPVHALALDQDENLYAGGMFNWAGGVRVSMIAQWDGTSWSSLGSGMGGAEYRGITALAVDQAGNLYAGGDFTTAGGEMTNHIARWNHASATWSSLGSGVNDTVRALAIKQMAHSTLVASSLQQAAWRSIISPAGTIRLRRGISWVVG